MNRRYTLFLASLVVLACSEPSAPEPKDDSPDAGLVTSQDAAPARDGLDARATDDAPRATPVQFTLRNDTTQVIYLRADGFWNLLRGDQILPAHDTCEHCNCQDLDCWVCGVALAAAIPIEPGAVHTWEWKGFEWRLRDGVKANVTCEQAEPAAAGPLVLRVHYTLLKAEASDMIHIGPVTMVTLDQPFHHPPAEPVTVVVR